jgi:hypothetical protein
MNEKTEELIEIIADNAYELGIIDGLKRAEYILKDRSGEHFKNGEDNLAHSYRFMSNLIYQEAKSKEDEYNPNRANDAWADLSNSFMEESND